MKYLFLLPLLFFGHNSFAQSVSEANTWFNKYEYAKAAEIFAECEKAKPLNEENFERLGYAYFVIGDYINSWPVLDSIVQRNSIQSFFYYAHGVASIGMERYADAKASLIKYQNIDGKINVSNLIASCDQIPNWTSEKHYCNTLYSLNTTKADFTGTSYSSQEIVFQEIGKDSVGININRSQMQNSELVLTRPFIYSGNDLIPINVIDTDTNTSITSLSFYNGSGELLLSVSSPLSKVRGATAPHLYTAKFDKNLNEISGITPWKYSGFEDSSSCAHATINSSGNVIVFSKVGSMTSESDLYYSSKIDGDWTAPVSIKSLNTELDDMFPMFMGDTLLSFASDGRPGYGGLDIYTSKVEGLNFSEVTHLKSPINSFKDDFNFIYYSIDSARYSSNRLGGIGDDDMYFVKFNEPVKPVEIDSSDFFNFVSNWKDEVIYFNFNKFNLIKDIEIIDQLVKFLNDNRKSTINIEGHADSRGSVKYNLNLGLSRANKVKNELIKSGIRSEQITVTTKGKNDPLVDCKGGCTEEQHAMNRVALLSLSAK